MAAISAAPAAGWVCAAKLASGPNQRHVAVVERHGKQHAEKRSQDPAREAAQSALPHASTGIHSDKRQDEDWQCGHVGAAPRHADAARAIYAARDANRAERLLLPEGKRVALTPRTSVHAENLP